MTEYIGDSWNMEYFAEFSGDADPFVPPEHIEGWHAELSAVPSDYEVVLFEGGLHGFAMKYSEATYQVIAVLSGQTPDAVIYDDEGVAVGIQGTFMYDQEHRDFAFNRIDELFEEYGVTATATEEPTDGGDDECACDMSGYVSMEDFDALRAEVRELQGSIGSVEADNNDVMNAMEDMATCMSGIVDGFSGDDSDDTEEPMTEAPETTRMRTTVMETTTTTTDMPTKMPSLFPTARMTEKWETMAKLMDGGNNKCSTGADARAFRLTYTSLDNCVDRCYADERCMYASTDEVQWCIGCIQLDRATDGWNAYEMLRGRRQLSEVEQLRRENAALKAELARVRRN